MKVTSRFALALALALAGFSGACGGDEEPSKSPSTVECTSDVECEDNEICDEASGQCVPTSANSSNSQNSTNAQNSTNSANADNNANAANATNNQNGAECGNGVVEGDEICDGNCPAACDDGDACTMDASSGSADTCDLLCDFDPITTCTSGDGCCPSGCDGTTDDDCVEFLCGNGAVDGGETCDPTIAAGNPGACLSEQECVGPDACTTATYAGSADTCDATCDFDPITTCVDDDGCCPAACDDSLDNDCLLATGAACTTNDACQSGFCNTEDVSNWSGGYCTEACSTDAECSGPGTRCTGRICVRECTADTDCREGYECYDLYGTGFDMCAPATTAALPGAACQTEDDCLGTPFGVACGEPQNGFAEGYCFAGCEVDADCPTDSHCTVTGDGAVCVPNCQPGSNTCRAGYECFDYLGDPRNTCGPVASGAGVVADACAVLQDCAGGQDGFCIQSGDFLDGYCTETCTSDGDCPANTHCAFESPGDPGACVANCTTETDCTRTGYGCIDRDEDQVLECLPSGVGGGAIGDICGGVYDCNGGVDAVCVAEASGWRDGYCSLSCATDSDCPTPGSHCAFNSAGDGLCLKDCLNGADCRADGYTCWNVDQSANATVECAPSGTGAGAPGAACEGVWECAGATDAFCVSDDAGWPEGYCAVSGCRLNSDCASGAHCGFVDQQTGEGICLDDCSSDADCRADYACYDIEADNQRECLPIGDGAVGDACQGFWECAGREDAICAGEPNFPGGYCLLPCGSGQPACPSESECITFGNGASFCLDSCQTSGDCRTGYSCGAASATSGLVCLP